jgi:hypothetical protein
MHFESPAYCAPLQFRQVKATYIGAHGRQVHCRLEQDDPDATVNYCNKKGDIDWWNARSCGWTQSTCHELRHRTKRTPVATPMA